MDIRWTYSDIGGGPAGQSLPEVATTLKIGLYSVEIRLGSWCRFTRNRPTNHRHRHQGFHEMCLVTAGRGTLRHGRRTYELQTGDLTAADPGVTHEICSADGDLELIFLTLAIQGFPGNDPPWTATLIKRFCESHRVHAGGQQHLLSHIDLLRATGPAATWRRQHSLTALAVEGLAVLTKDPPLFDVSAAPVYDPIALACDFIDRHIGRNISVAEMALASNLSEPQLRRLFLARLKRSPLSEIRRRRIQSATAHLLMGASVGEAGQAIGIADPSQFTRDFRRHWGMTPSQWIAGHQQPGPTRTEHV